MKKATCYFLIVLLLFSSFAYPVAAIVPPDDAVDPEQARIAQIEALYTERAWLLSESEINQDAVDRVDAQLFSLGVEPLTQADIDNKVHPDAKPLVSVSSTSTVTWSSYRTIVANYGRQYEIQVITGQPNGTNSPLRSWSSVTRARTNLTAGVTKAVEAFVSTNIGDVISGAVSSALDEHPVASIILNAGNSLYAAFSEYASFTEDTIVSSIECRFDVLMLSTERYIYVKYANEADAGNQILGYVGNSIACTVIMNTLSSELYVENGVEYPELDEKTWRYQFKSGYYDNSYNKAVESFWLHDQGYTTYEYQVLHGVKLQFLMPIGSNSGKEFFSVPYAGTTFL